VRRARATIRPAQLNPDQDALHHAAYRHSRAHTEPPAPIADCLANVVYDVADERAGSITFTGS
jgi:hypothetical protein